MIDTGATLKRFCAGIFALAVAVSGIAGPAHSVTVDAALWEALRSGGHVALMRHAVAPGTGDPPDFTHGDCSTQRNLSEAGRDQAGRIGTRFRANGIDSADIYTSQWCRCRETAALLELGPVADLPALNSFFRRSADRNSLLDALKAWLAGRAFETATILVTHQVTITALTGIYPRSGEIVIVRPSPAGDVAVVGTIATD